MPIDMATKIKLLPNDTAANSVDPSLPTMILSTIIIRVCPNIPKIIGYASLKLYANSLVYFLKFILII